MAQPWTATDPRWQQLSPSQKATAMALMEADRMDPAAAQNALGAMINRASKSGQDLGTHVSQKIYQPTIEPNQQARLQRIMQSPEFQRLTGWADRRQQGLEPDPVQGATHFLAPPKTMLALEAREPGKYKNWGPRGANWTGYDEATGAYKNTMLTDASHHFVAPEGAHSVPYKGGGAASPTAVPDSDIAPPAAPVMSAAAPAAAGGAAAGGPAAPVSPFVASYSPDIGKTVGGAVARMGEPQQGVDLAKLNEQAMARYNQSEAQRRQQQQQAMKSGVLGTRNPFEVG